MKVTFQQYRAMREGLAQGACRLFTNEPPDIQAITNGYGKTQKSIKTFVAGYELANKSDEYFKAYKANKNLLAFAVERGDITPVGWYLHYGFHQITVEQN